jgi:hypothetical protein
VDRVSPSLSPGNQYFGWHGPGDSIALATISSENCGSFDEARVFQTFDCHGRSEALSKGITFGYGMPYPRCPGASCRHQDSPRRR